MKFPLWFFALLMSFGASMVRWFAADAPPHGDPDAASPIPPLTSKMVEQYALVGATDREIADRFLVEEELVRVVFANELRASRGLLHLSIRLAQFNLAIKDHNTTMLNWMGRNYLGQSNNPEKPSEPEPEFVD